MAYRNPFNPRGTDYRGAQESMDRAQRDLTSALDAKGKADKQARIKKSGERSGMEKLLSAAGRAGIAYATGGASEALGFGGAVDDIMLGTDSEGNSVRNEYGDLVEAGTKVYGAMDANKASDIASKRKLNRQDFQDRLDYASKVGEYDAGEGVRLRGEAMDLRDRQIAQTKAADEKGTWGWDNTFDDLGLSGTQKAKVVADKAKQERILGSEDRRQGGQLAGYKDLKEIQDLKERRTSAREEASRSGLEELGRQRLSSKEADRFSREGVLNEQTLADYKADRENAIKSLPNRRPDIWMASQDRPTESKTGDRLIKQMAVDDMMDSEYNKKISRGGLYSGSKDDVLTFGTEADRESNESETNWQGPYKARKEGGHEYFQQGGMGKTFSEKEAEKLSRKDAEGLRAGSMDDIAIDTKGKQLEDRYSGLSGKALRLKDEVFNPEDIQLYDEYAIGKKGEAERIKKLLNDQGPDANPYRKGSMTNPWESKLKKRLRNRREIDQASDAMLMESFKNIGGILA
jgi:hypothetical protein